ncbi:MAG: hypothetical protein OEY28_06205 [Nitrospira sp.]|nr:hypothetical protein [Nitrospira sp.]
MATNMTDAEPAQNVPEKIIMTARERVQKCRQSLKNRQRRRFEACVDVAVIDEVTAVAEALEVPVWKAVENALADYCEEYDALIAEQQRLDNERPRIEQCGSRPDAETFKQDLRRYNERVSRFLRQRVDPSG